MKLQKIMRMGVSTSFLLGSLFLCANAAIKKEDVINTLKAIQPVIKTADTLLKIEIAGDLIKGIIPGDDEKAKNVIVALLRFGSGAAAILPDIVEALLNSPDIIKTSATNLRDGVKAWKTYSISPEFTNLSADEKKAIKTKRLNELTIYATDASTVITGLVYKLMKLAKRLGPIVEAIDKPSGDKLNQILTTLVYVIKMINTVNLDIRAKTMAELPKEVQAKLPKDAPAEANEKDFLETDKTINLEDLVF